MPKIISFTVDAEVTSICFFLGTMQIVISYHEVKRDSTGAIVDQSPEKQFVATVGEMTDLQRTTLRAIFPAIIAKFKANFFT